MKKGYIDTASSEEFEYEVVSNLKGINVLIDGLETMMYETNHEYIGFGLRVLGKVVGETIEKASETQELIVTLDNKIEVLENTSK